MRRSKTKLTVAVTAAVVAMLSARANAIETDWHFGLGAGRAESRLDAVGRLPFTSRLSLYTKLGGPMRKRVMISTPPGATP